MSEWEKTAAHSQKFLKYTRQRKLHEGYFSGEFCQIRIKKLYGSSRVLGVIGFFVSILLIL